MAKDIKLLIGGNSDKAQAELRELQGVGKDVAKELARDFALLGIKSEEAFKRKREAAKDAYARIEASGKFSTAEVARAEQALANQLVRIDQEQFGRRTSMLEKFKANWLAVTASMTAAYFAVMKGWELAKGAAEGLQQRQSFANLAASHGASADQIIEDLKRVSAQTISTKDLIQAAGTSMLLGISAKDLAGLMEIARASARVTGQSVKQAFEDISLAVARGSNKILDNLGIIVSVEKANADYAAALGKTAEQLTEADKRQAFMNATLSAGEEIVQRVGLETVTMMERMQRAEATVANLKESVGRLALTLGGAFLGAIQVAGAAATQMIGRFAQGMELLFKLPGAIPFLGKPFRSVSEELGILGDAAIGASGNLWGDSQNSFASALDAITGKLDLASGSQMVMTGEMEDASAAAKKQAEAMKNGVASLDKFSRAMSDLGKDQLRFADARFSKELALQGEELKKNGKMASDLSQPLRSYLALIERTYGAQLEAQRGIAATLKEIGASEQARLNQQVTILNAEKAGAEERLKAWTSYYTSLKSRHAEAVDAMKKKQEELLAIQNFGQNLRTEVNAKFNPAQEISPYEQYYTSMERIDADAAQAMTLTGQKKIDALQKLQQKLRDLPTEVRDGSTVVVSSLEVYDQVINRLNKFQVAAEAAKMAEAESAKTKAQALQEEMLRAEAAMQLVQDKVIDLGTKIAALSQAIVLSVADNASTPIANIQKALDNLKDKTITITTRYVSSGGGGGGGSSSSSSYDMRGYGGFDGLGIGNPGSYGGSYHTGTSYVPRTGPYMLNRGEQVLNRQEAKQGQGGQVSINAPISVTVNESKTPQQTAREVARMIAPELQKLMPRYT